MNEGCSCEVTELKREIFKVSSNNDGDGGKQIAECPTVASGDSKEKIALQESM